MENGRIQLFSYRDEFFNVHHSVSENYEDPYTKLHMHSMYEIYYFIDGKGEFHVSGNTYKLEPGMIIVMLPGEAHSMTVYTDKQYERVSIHFDQNYFEGINIIDTILNSFSKRKYEYGNCYLEVNANSIITNLISEMTNPALKDSNEKMLALVSNLPALLYHLSIKITQNTSVTGASRDNLVWQTIKYIDENLYKNWTLDDLAAKLYRDKAYLNRRFKKIIGTGIWDYTIRKRIIGIKQRIHSFSSVNEAFKSSGFGDYSTFFRNYVKVTGNNPSDDIKQSLCE